MLDSIGQVIMGKIENIERQIETLSPEELAQFRAWFLEFDCAAWDLQLEADIQAGKLDRLVQDARRDHTAGKITPLRLVTPPRSSGPRIVTSRQKSRGSGATRNTTD
jgi:hypothetical protein